MNLVLGCWLMMIMMMGSAFAYVIPLQQSSRSSTTQLHWFGNNSKPQNAKQQPEKKTFPVQKKKPASTEEVTTPTRPPFIFLYGKPQYDWTTGKPISKDSWVNKRRMNWLVKPKKET